MRFNARDANANSLNTLVKAWTALGLDKSNTNQSIAKKYRALALKVHPNKGGNTAAFQELQRLYDAALGAYRAGRMNAVAAAVARRQHRPAARPVKKPAARPAARPVKKPAIKTTATRPIAPSVVLFSSRSAGPGVWRRTRTAPRTGFYGLSGLSGLWN